MNSVFSVNKSSAHLLISFPLYFSSNNEKTSTQVLKKNPCPPKSQKFLKIQGITHFCRIHKATGQKEPTKNTVKYLCACFTTIPCKHALLVLRSRMKASLPAFCHHCLNPTDERKWSMAWCSERIRMSDFQSNGFYDPYIQRVCNLAGSPRCPR